MDEPVSYYQYCAPDGRVIANIYIHGTPDMERWKRATAEFLRKVYEREARQKLEEETK